MSASILNLLSIDGLIGMIVLLPLATSILNFIFASTSRGSSGGAAKAAAFFGVAGPLLAFFASFWVFWILTGIEGSRASALTGPFFKWAVFADWQIEIGLRADELSLIMSLLVTGVGTLIHIYSLGYMDRDDGFCRYFAQLNLFLFFMLVLVLADNMLLMFVGWEGVGLCSYLLISFWFTDIDKARAGKKAFIVNRIGDAAMLVGILWIWHLLAGQTLAGHNPLNFETIERNAAFLVAGATPICLLLFAGACGKSAQLPLFVWLPDAMTGPTPVSALIHAATMVTAGIYMVARLNFLFALSPVALSVVAIVGAITMLMGAIFALTQRDIKKVLAYSTISQLGMMFMSEGLGAYVPAVFHLVIHAFFKAALFMGAGAVIHALGGEQDIFKMGGLKKRLPGTFWSYLAAAVAMCGIFPSAGFYSKGAILWEAFYKGDYWLWAAGFATAALTAFYSFRVIGLVFFGKPRAGSVKTAGESSPSMLIPLVILGMLSLFGGLMKEAFGDFLGGRFVESFTRAAPTHKNLSHILEIINTLWAAHWAFVAWIIYVQRPEWMSALAGRFRRTYRLISNACYIDAFYSYAIVAPVLWVSRNVIYRGVDKAIINDVCVEGPPRVVSLAARLGVSLQTGQTAHYIFFMVVGLSFILLLMFF